MNDLTPPSNSDQGMYIASKEHDNLLRDPEVEPFQSSLLVEKSAVFEQHLQNRSQKIRTVITDLFAKTSNPSADVKELQDRLATLLAAEKAHVVELQRITADRDSLVDRLEVASYRYMVAEKRLDRAKSAVVQKLEQQAIMKREDDTATASAALQKANTSDANGDVNSAVNAASDSARREALATAERRKLQIDQLESENKQLQEQLTAAKIARTVVTDDDYAKTALFTQLKSQAEDAIKRLNDLEATNIQLREEAQKLHSERSAFRTAMDDEARAATTENEGDKARLEADLTRLRHQRDDLAADNAVRRTALTDSKKSSEAGAELASAREDRITALETQLERIRVKTAADQSMEEDPAIDSLGPEELKVKLHTLQKAEAMLNKELASMEAAWRKSQQLAAKKVTEITAWEEQIARATAEKAKADQKYFAAMKAKESREGELRALKAQNAKTSEIVTQLKDAESSNRALSTNLERQVAEAKDNLNVANQQVRSSQQKLSEGTVLAETLKTEIAELKKLLEARDTTTASSAAAKRTIEVELDEAKIRLEESKKSIESLQKRAAGNNSSDTDDWRVCPFTL